ncbi:hypothetical protein HG560_03420 [Helicobacter pylori]|uniref:Periplasmic protein n=1 Tax=Helicobacter pylori TaxID=210 RepID=A0AAE7P945_HELPX|nr:hypothetical protein [Helicobacter pylori]AFI00906.1 hypothetical protein HPSH112_03510 [Helicobacter pylori Shi112]QQW93592.1 hypothetical protein HG560_03420 [Helicobacter pylori]QQX50963.1 hypothetical protein HG562_03425 [Helicobacter pylori]
MRFFSFFYFLLYFLGVSLYALNPLENQEFLISYRLKIVDSRVIGEEYSVSKPIVSRIKTAPYVLDYHCSIIIRNSPDLKESLLPVKLERFLLEIALKKEKERVIDCILKSQVAITHYDHSYKNGTTTTSILNLKALSVRASLVGDALFLDIFRKEEE